MNASAVFGQRKTPKKVEKSTFFGGPEVGWTGLEPVTSRV